MEDDLDLTMAIPAPTFSEEVPEDLSARIEAAIAEMKSQLEQEEAQSAAKARR